MLGVLAPVVLKGAFDLVDQLFDSDEEKRDAKLKVMELAQKGQLAQLAVNQTEAGHGSLFVAGWRPGIGWVCGFALAYTYIIQPFLVFTAWALASFAGVTIPIDQLPEIEVGALMPVLLGMLGLGAMRSYEKTKGVESTGVGGDKPYKPSFDTDPAVDRRANR